MRIDARIEDPLRNAFAAVVDREPSGIEPALEVLDEEQSSAVLNYAVFVVGYVMHDVFGEDTDSEAAEVMAERLIPRVSDWSGVGDYAQVAAFLAACSTGDGEFAGVDPENVAGYSLIIGGNLLSRHRPEGMRWFEYLDQIWNYAESLPENT